MRRPSTLAAFFLFTSPLALGAFACGSGASAPADDPGFEDEPGGASSSSSSSGSGSPGGGSSSGGAPGGGDGGGADAAPRGPLPLPVFASLAQDCKLVNGRNLDDFTPNQTHLRANVRGTDLGYPVAHGTDLYFFFGDTGGYRAIWALGPESLPDAVGFSGVGRAAVTADPKTLCTNFRFLRSAPEASAGRSVDGRIEGDFLAQSMTAPAGRPLSEFIHNPAGPRGANAFPNLPGDFEVPSGAFSHGGAIYVYYTTVVSPQVVQMKGSYLAKWDAPRTTGAPNYRILHHVDQRFDANGALRGDFVNVAPLVQGEWLYLYGSGEYRASPVHLARKKVAAVEAEGGYERFDAATGRWVPPRTAGTRPVVASPSVGELSVQYFANLGRYVMTNQEITQDGNQIVARFAERPEGPWSDKVVMATMHDPAFGGKYCCVANDCAGERLFHCDRAGFYAPYLLPDATRNADGTFTLHFVMSTWDPYNVALLRATFRG